jgi:hypothetical protein
MAPFFRHFTLSSAWFCKCPFSVFQVLSLAGVQPRGHETNAAVMSFRTNVRNLDLSVAPHVPKDDTSATSRFLTQTVRNDMIREGCGGASMVPRRGMAVNRVQHDVLPKVGHIKSELLPMIGYHAFRLHDSLSLRRTYLSRILCDWPELRSDRCALHQSNLQPLTFKPLTIPSEFDIRQALGLTC